MQIVPALLETREDRFRDKLDLVTDDGEFSVVQVDVIDGYLLPTQTVTPYDLVDEDFGQLHLDWHLMTEDPLDYVWEIAAQGRCLPTRRIYGQVERMSDQKAFLAAIRQQHWQAGLALDLETPLDSIDDDVWELLDSVLLLAVPMGAQGQVFDQQVIDKLHELAALVQKGHLDLDVTVDGGVTPELLPTLAAHGVHEAVMGSYFWHQDFALASAKAREVLADINAGMVDHEHSHS